MAAPCPVWLVPPDWPPLVRRILVPVGLFERDLASLRTAVRLARRFPRARVLALHVHLEGARVADETAHQRIQRRQQDALEAFLARVDADGVSIESHLAVGMHVPDVIAAAAHRLSIDLVVLSTRGRSRLASLLMPSIAERTARQSPASILVLKKSDSLLGFFGALSEKMRRTESLPFN
jgi:nucleotide-binding universal stress UspA family protein